MEQRLETAWMLQLVQNTFALMLIGASRFRHITPLLWELHWSPVDFHVLFKVLGVDV